MQLFNYGAEWRRIFRRPGYEMIMVYKNRPGIYQPAVFFKQIKESVLQKFEPFITTKEVRFANGSSRYHIEGFGDEYVVRCMVP